MPDDCLHDRLVADTGLTIVITVESEVSTTDPPTGDGRTRKALRIRRAFRPRVEFERSDECSTLMYPLCAWK